MIDCITSEEFLDMSLQLEEYHAVFNQLWQMGKPILTEEIDTAAIRFDHEGQWVDFLFNPTFWKESTFIEKKFVICHECLHVILNHGVRMADTNSDNTNICLDIPINHLLVRNFGFRREDLGSIGKKGCWVDTVFPDKNMPDDQTFEYYFSQLQDGNQSLLVDDHSFLSGQSDEWNEVIDRLNNNLADQDKESLKGIIQKHSESQIRGTEAIGRWTFVNADRVKPKKKWETVIKKWSRKYDRPDIRDVEQWSRLNRRFAFVNKDLLLPTEMEEEHEIEGKICVFFFQDTSGSCWHLKDRFFRAARSLPKDRFDVRMFCFDSKVYEIDISKNRIRGGGGTSFSIIENKIQSLMNIEKIPYPKAVFLITDGYGNRVFPQTPENWYWFLSGNYTFCIPARSNVFKLKDFE
jgi:hypothetical protein